MRGGVVLLDEPTTHLDLPHAVDVLDLVVRLRAEGRTVVTVLHDLGLAARYSDWVVVMKDGRVRAERPPAEVLDAAMLADVFGLDAHVCPDPVDGLPTVVPTGHARRVCLGPTRSLTTGRPRAVSTKRCSTARLLYQE